MQGPETGLMSKYLIYGSTRGICLKYSTSTIVIHRSAAQSLHNMDLRKYSLISTMFFHSKAMTITKTNVREHLASVAVIASKHIEYYRS